MIVTYVHVWVKPEHINEFIVACEANQKESVKEEGNLRFDLSQDVADPTKFIIYEAYKTEANVKAHKETDHYKTWRSTVEHMMLKPRKGERYNLLSI